MLERHRGRLVEQIGDGGNVAARLEGICGPGGIMVSGTAFGHLAGRVPFALEFAGARRVNGSCRPVRAERAIASIEVLAAEHGSNPADRRRLPECAPS